MNVYMNDMELLEKTLGLKEAVENGCNELAPLLIAYKGEGTRRGLGDWVILTDSLGREWPF